MQGASQARAATPDGKGPGRTAPDHGGAGRRVRAAVVAAVAAVVLAATAAGVPGAPSLPRASAVPLPGDPPPHWGRSPYFPDCLEGPCRAVLVIDKTFDPAWSAQIRRWVTWMTHVRVNHNLNLPALGYVGGGTDGVLPDPACHAFPAAITICLSDAVVDADCNLGGTGVLCLQSTRTVPDNHFHSARLSYRPRDYHPADRWNLVCSQLGKAIGLSTAQPDLASCMHSPIMLLGAEKYYVVDDWVTLWTIYGHPPP